MWKRMWKETGMESVKFGSRDLKIAAKDSLSEEIFLKWIISEWLHTKRLRVKESTYANYLHAIERHILPQLGEIEAEQVSSALIEQFLQDKLLYGRLDGQGGLSPKSVADLRVILKSVLEFGYIRGYFPQRIEFPKISGHQLKTEIFSQNEQKQLEKELFFLGDPFSLGILLSLYAGLRIGEVCALQWENICLETGIVHIKKTMLRIQDTSPDAVSKTKILVNSPKTQCSIRAIPLPDFIIDYLQHHRRAGHCYVLTGTPQFIEPRNCLERYKRILTQAGIPHHTFHALRHTFATRCVEQGVDVKSLSEIMGHSSITITMQRYVHPTMELKRSQMNKLKLFIDVET